MIYIKTSVWVFLLWTFIGVLSKLVFIPLYLSDYTVSDWGAVVRHGLLLDLSVAGYFSLLPGLMLIISTWWKSRLQKWLWHSYFILTSMVAVLGYVSNLALYRYWRFPLDSTPLLYIKTSPADAFASMTSVQLVCIPLMILGCGALVSLPFLRLWRMVENACLMGTKARISYSLILLLLTCALILPIRGGVDTGTNHTGSVYFSSDIKLNHAAVNPIFSFVESVTHQEDIASRYRFMEDKEARNLIQEMTYTHLRPDTRRHDYNVVLICLEGFSKYIMKEGGHVEGVTPNLDRYTEEGIYFTNFYSNSFRTDRGLVSVLSSLPAQPTMSVMDMPKISTSLPSIARTLSKEGYDTHFYYGGDANYSNMKSYLMGTGFQSITAQFDFDPKLQTGKWGVADGPVFERLLHDIKSADAKKPFFKVIMTGSSHEPFDVPDYRKLKSPELNAFSYADHHLGRFIEGLKQLSCWQNTLVLIVPDHLGAYPLEIDNYSLWRYEIPFIIMGADITPRKIDTVGSQIDISATLLSILGLQHQDFLYSKDLLDTSSPHFAFFTFPDAMGIVEQKDYLFYDNTSNKIVKSSGNNTDDMSAKAKAYLQILYDNLAEIQKRK